MPNEINVEGKSCEDTASSPAQPLPFGVETGSEVWVRGERWTVRAIVPHGDCSELHLCNAFEPGGRVLLWPFDRPVARATVRRLRCFRLRRWWATVAPLFTTARVD